MRKSQLASKTNWLGIASVVAGVITYIAADPVLHPYPDAQAIMLVIVGVLGVIIRQLTSRPLKPLLPK